MSNERNPRSRDDRETCEAPGCQRRYHRLSEPVTLSGGYKGETEDGEWLMVQISVRSPGISRVSSVRCADHVSSREVQELERLASELDYDTYRAEQDHAERRQEGCTRNELASSARDVDAARKRSSLAWRKLRAARGW